MSFGGLPTVKGPRDLPELRAWMIKHWREDGPFDWLADAYMVRRQLDTAPLWWVTTEMCDLLADSAQTYPDDAVLNMAEIENPAGFAVFEDDFEGIDADPAHLRGEFGTGSVRVSAILWGPSSYVPYEGQSRHGISFNIFCRMELHDGLAADDLHRVGGHLAALGFEYPGDDRRPLTGTLFAYLGRTDWLHGGRIDDLLPDNPHGINQVTLDSMAEDRRLMASLWKLTQMPMTRTYSASIPRPVVRRAQRAGQDPAVRVVTLRHYDDLQPAGTQVSVERRREWKHSWVVRPHWCWQPYGPGNSLRKLIMRGPFTKGPKDKPMIGGERVWKVVPPK